MPGSLASFRFGRSFALTFSLAGLLRLALGTICSRFRFRDGASVFALSLAIALPIRAFARRSFLDGFPVFVGKLPESFFSPDVDD